MIALVTTVMAFVYPNLTKLYDNFNNRTKYYDQPEDLYVLKMYSELLTRINNENSINSKTNNGCKIFNDGKLTSGNEISISYGSIKINSYTISPLGGISNLYITGYMTEVSDNNYNFNKYLKRMKKTTYDSASYRLIGKFGTGNNIRYASIKIENPDPNRNCNLGGKNE